MLDPKFVFFNLPQQGKPSKRQENIVFSFDKPESNSKSQIRRGKCKKENLNSVLSLNSPILQFHKIWAKCTKNLLTDLGQFSRLEIILRLILRVEDYGSSMSSLENALIKTCFHVCILFSIFFWEILQILLTQKRASRAVLFSTIKNLI